MYNKQIAIIHEWFTEPGGSEKVVAQIIALFPEADIFTLFKEDKVLERFKINKSRVTASYLNNFPFVRKYYRYLFPLYPYAIESFDLSKYDIIISSSHCAAKGVLTFHDQIHICYCHSPVRYIWDLHFEYLNSIGGFGKLFKYALRYYISKFRIWDQVSSSRVDKFIANSAYVAKRIKKNYGRDSEVIYPFIDCSKFSISTSRDDYYVTCSRFVPYKRVDLIVKAFAKLNLKLLVIGDGPDRNKLLKMKTDNISFMTNVSNEDLVIYISRAKAFIYAADEDFGIAPVEAQACGIPVICYAKGGLTETVIDEVTGLFFYEQTDEALMESVRIFEKRSHLFSPQKIRENALRFDLSHFNEKIREKVKVSIDHIASLK